MGATATGTNTAPTVQQTLQRRRGCSHACAPPWRPAGGSWWPAGRRCKSCTAFSFWFCFRCMPLGEECNRQSITRNAGWEISCRRWPSAAKGVQQCDQQGSHCHLHCSLTCRCSASNSSCSAFNLAWVATTCCRQAVAISSRHCLSCWSPAGQSLLPAVPAGPCAFALCIEGKTLLSYCTLPFQRANHQDATTMALNPSLGAHLKATA